MGARHAILYFYCTLMVSWMALEFKIGHLMHTSLDNYLDYTRGLMDWKQDTGKLMAMMGGDSWLAYWI